MICRCDGGARVRDSPPCRRESRIPRIAKRGYAPVPGKGSLYNRRMSGIDSDKPTDRRGFFREGLASLLAPLAGIVERRLNHVRDSIAAAMPAEQTRLLRPPGALPEPEFLRTCQSCGRCASSCPVGAIFMRRREQPRQPGLRLADITPVISAQSQPCVLCASLACMAACPSGALVRTPVERVCMGTAAWSADRCLRTAGHDCRRCIEQCPRGSNAIGLGETQLAGMLPAVVVEYAGCAGCGVCEHACPAAPKAIVVYGR